MSFKLLLASNMAIGPCGIVGSPRLRCFNVSTGFEVLIHGDMILLLGTVRESFEATLTEKPALAQTAGQ